MDNTITFAIYGGIVQRHDKAFDVEEVRRVTDAIKQKYGLGWAGVAPLFNLQPNNGGAMNIKKWRSGKQAMPRIHYYTALMLLDEFHIEINHLPKSKKK